MKTLFLIDGAYQAAKTAFCSILREKSGWVLIKKDSTKPADKQDIDMQVVDINEAERRLKKYTAKESTKKERLQRRWFCYKYPELDGYKDTINCIDTDAIDNLVEDLEKPYGFLIVRDHQCINDLIDRYETNGSLNVVPVFLYTDYTYISATGDEEVIAKWNKLLRSYIWNYDDSIGKINYERVLIFNGERGCTYPSDIAVNNLRRQLEELVKQVENKNSDLVVVTASERTFIPKEIRGRKLELEKAIVSPEKYRKTIFIMMKFHDSVEKDQLYLKIKNAIESNGYSCVRADDGFVKRIFPNKSEDNKPSLVYWLATFLCGQGIAIFERNNQGNIELNPNVAYEMGIMKQQGKHVDIFVPDTAQVENEDLFFDIKDCWKNKYNDDQDLINKIIKTIKEYD